MQMLELLSQSPALAVGGAIVLGLLVGSFLNVVILRLPQMLENEWQRRRPNCAATKRRSTPNRST
jgi:leader peptidase (prepilin peptidase)/N-methyltransferase